MQIMSVRANGKKNTWLQKSLKSISATSTTYWQYSNKDWDHSECKGYKAAGSSAKAAEALELAAPGCQPCWEEGQTGAVLRWLPHCH